MQKEALSKEERKTRSNIYFYAWKKYKKQHPMSRMAKILKVELSNLYKILKRKESK